MGFYDHAIVFVLISLQLNTLCLCEASSNDLDLCIPSERQALLNFKHHLLDPSNRLASWSDGNTDCCNWALVTCNRVTGRVLELHLSTSIPSMDWENVAYEGPRFAGKLHRSILDLKRLSFLDLSGNDFRGMQIPSFFYSMKSLTYLNLSNTGLSGSIPHQIGNLSGLLYLDFGDNYLTGSIPHQIGNLSGLLHVDLADNFFIGSIPHQIGNLSGLLHLNLEGNYFIGKIPHQIGNLSNLLYLALSGDVQYDMDVMQLILYREDLQWISSLSSLQYLDLNSVNLSNAFDWLPILQGLPSLIELHLLSCALPHSFHPATTINISSITILDLSSSLHFGSPSIPKWIFQLKNLVSLELRDNQLQGSIPDGIHNLTLIENLDLSYNLLNSSIPDWLYSLSHLKSLDLSSNSLHGTISHAIENLTFMVTLDLSDNNLVGPFPNSLSNLCNLKSVSLFSKNCNQQVSEVLDIFSRCASNTLESMSITGSKLYGHLTPQIGIFKNLHAISLAGNSLKGTLPIPLGNLTSLNYLSISGNQFEGNPFDVIQSLFELRDLDISDNLFHGIVSEYQLANFTNLISLDASRDKLSLKVAPNWKPSFQKLHYLSMESVHLGPRFPSWIRSLKYVHELSIGNNNISDSIPIWVWDEFPYAYYFDFSNNDIPGDLTYTLKNPINTDIDLSSNHLSGPLPYISPHVTYLDLSSNWFSGSIASFLCQEKEDPMMLEYLNLASNNLLGEIPNCWKMWSNNLMIIKFDNNHFNGNLPSSIGSLTWLNSLQLRNNTISGNFPICLKSNTKLVFLDLRENQFSGIIPSWVGHILPNLKILLLRSNKFNGEIPNQICSLNSLHILDLAQNDLIGQIPKCFSHLKVMQVKNTSLESYMLSQGNKSSFSLTNVLLELKGRDDVYASLGLITSIDLSDNKLSGEVPSEITSLEGLHFLNLSKNVLSSEIPQNIGDMGSLESMDISKNQLWGEIPSSISNLNFLSKLNLSFNNLMGKIPTGTQLQSFEASSFMGNDLCGPPLPKKCDSAYNDLNHDHDVKEGKGNEIDWFYVSMLLGFVSGFWVVVGPLLYSRSWRYTYFKFLDCMWYKLQSCWST